ncbi:MAG: hypothetical protein WDN01_17390 [Rhizomicrobium sp.]
MHVAVIDIGSPKNLGWAIRGAKINGQGGGLDECIAALGLALTQGQLALGFEAPLFVPLRDDPFSLTKARAGECAGGINRPFSAAAGASVLVTALTIVPHVLSRLRVLAPGVSATMDWRTPLASETRLLVFEAFVTNQGKSSDARHIEDAYAAIAAFQRGMEEPETFASAVTEDPCLSLIGAALLRTEWTTDLRALSRPCLVVRA